MEKGRRRRESTPQCPLPGGIQQEMAVTTCRCPKCGTELTVGIPYRQT